MVNTVTDMIVGVQPRVITSKKNGQQYTVFDIQTGNNGTIGTFKQDDGRTAMSMVGQPAILTIEQDGQYGKLLAVAPAGPMAATIAHTQQAMATQQPKVNGYPYEQNDSVTQEQARAIATGTAPIDRDTSIHRQVAAKVAGHISQNSTEFWSNVEDLFNYFQTGISPLANKAAAQPQESYSAPVPQDDIPFR